MTEEAQAPGLIPARSMPRPWAQRGSLLWLLAAAWPLAATSASGLADTPCNTPSSAQLATMRRAVEKNLSPQSRAIAHVHTEGTLPHQGIWDASVEAERDWPLMRQLAQLWQAERKSEDAQALSRLLADWAGNYQPNFNPIDETNLDAYLDAYAIAREALDPVTQASARQFIRLLAEGYLQQMETGFRPRDGRWLNNWNSHRIKLAALAAAALNDQALWGRARQAFVAHLARNIRSDGATLDFEERDALHYVVYDLEPLLRAAQVAQKRGESWLKLTGNGGGSLEAALDWLTPYAMGEKVHEEFVHSRVAFDAKRSAAGLPGFSGSWKPEGSARLFAMAATLDARYAPVVQRLNPDGSSPWVCWSNQGTSALSDSRHTD